MLITNFASGELSQDLYGRIDIPQYYSGAAHLENFDVMPTGGIKRRSGMRRLSELEAAGRLVPFVINREKSFILHLMPGSIQVYKVENGEAVKDGQPVTDIGGRALYAAEEIAGVQYAQNFDTMILVHENHPPVEVRYINGGLTINLLNYIFNIQIIADGEITDQEIVNHSEEDKQYYNNGWLVSEGNYPAAVSFFNGRIIFAGTKNSPQRVFVSTIKEADKPYNFSTKKIFLTLKKEYLAIKGDIQSDGKIQIALDYLMKFNRPLNDYYLDTLYYPKGTKIKSLINDLMELYTETSGYLFDLGRIEGEILAKEQAYNAAESKNLYGWYNNNTGRIGIYDYTYYVNLAYSSYSRRYQTEWYIHYGANNIQFRERTRIYYTSWEPWNDYNRGGLLGIIPEDITKSKNDIEIKNLIREKVEEGAALLRAEYDSLAGSYYNRIFANGDRVELNERSFSFTTGMADTIINYMSGVIDQTMKYLLYADNGEFEKWYHNIPVKYKTEILPYIQTANEIYINFYTREIMKEEYPTPDCGFTFEVGSDMNDAIRWLAVNKGLIIGTEAGEYIMPPETHAANVYVVSNSTHGSDKIPGLRIGDATCFFTAGRKSLVEYYIPEADNHFRANNMALLAPQMLRESPAKEFDFAAAPYTRLYITRDDGQMVTLLYERNTGTFAWGRITTGEVVQNVITPKEMAQAWAEKDKYRKSNYTHYDLEKFIPPEKLERHIEGRIESAAVLPGESGYDDVYLIVKRGGKFFLEILQEDSSGTPDETVYLDSFREWKWDVETDAELETIEINEGDPQPVSKEALLASYPAGRAVIVDEKADKVWDIGDEELPPQSDEDNPRFIGYRYTSYIKSMPIQGSGRMEHTDIIGLRIRYGDSYLVRKKENSATQYKTVTFGNGGEPCTGVRDEEFRSGADTTAQFELATDKPGRCRILAVYAKTGK